MMVQAFFVLTGRICVLIACALMLSLYLFYDLINHFMGGLHGSIDE